MEEDRTPYPHDASEVSAAAQLAGLERAIESTRVALSEDDPEAGDAAGREVVRAARALRRTWEALDRNSPFRTFVGPQALHLLEELCSEEGAADLISRPAWDEERADLTLLVARQDVAAALESALESTTLRAVASRTHLSPSYLSELRQGKTGPPTDNVATKLDKALKINLAELGASARSRAQELKQEARARARRLEQQRAERVPSSEAQRLADLTGILANDRDLLDLVETLVAMPKPSRHALGQFLRGMLES